MRIVVVVSQLPPHQAPEGNHVLHLCRHLRALGHDARVLTGRDQRPAAGWDVPVHPDVAGWRWRGLPSLLAAVRRRRPDAVLVFYVGWLYAFHPMVTALPALRRLAGAGRATVVAQFTNVQELRPRWGRVLAAAARVLPGRLAPDPRAGWLLAASDHVIAMSDRHLEVLATWDPRAAGRATVIPAPPVMTVLPDPDGRVRAAGRAMARASAGDFLLAFFGYVYPGKGVETLLSAVAELGRGGVPARLTVVGGLSDPDYAADLRAQAERLGIADRVVWTGSLPEVEVSTALHGADACALPFDVGVRLNNTTVAVAAAHGLPILGTAGPVVEPAFRHGENVWLCPPGDPAALAAAARRVAADPDLRRRLAAGARRLADEAFSWDHNVRATLRACGVAAAAITTTPPPTSQTRDRT